MQLNSNLPLLNPNLMARYSAIPTLKASGSNSEQRRALPMTPF
jgi:hypothetical protein